GREALDAFFARAMQEAAAIDGAFASQAREPATRPGSALRDLAESMSAEARRCGVPLDEPLRSIHTALAQLDAARALLHAAEPDDAQARLEWVNARAGAALPIPGLSRRSSLRIRDWSPPLRGKRCIGPGGAAPVRDAAEDASTVAKLLGIDERRLRIARAADIATAREALRHSTELLC